MKCLAELTEFEKNTIAIAKLNARLDNHNASFSLRMLHDDDKVMHRYENIEICGDFGGRRHWHDIVDLVNAYDYNLPDPPDSPAASFLYKLFGAFNRLASQSVDELLVKLDLQFAD